MGRIKNKVSDDYFEWLFDLVATGRKRSYRKLLLYLHETPFEWFIPMDENRAYDGIELRYRFAGEHSDSFDVEAYLDGPCSVLEMMVALAIRCEEHIMDDDEIGDRTRQWFWEMITNLGLGGMSDSRFSEYSASMVVQRFLDRDYEPNGKGGLFTVRHHNEDMRDVEIWYQLCYYLEDIV